MAIDETFLTARIAAAEAEIVAYESAITALSDGAQSYQLDTGQTRTLVTKANLGHMSEQLERALSRLSVLCNRRDRTGSVVARPVF